VFLRRLRRWFASKNEVEVSMNWMEANVKCKQSQNVGRSLSVQDNRVDTN
jgi:hypothetical protein